MKKLIFIVALIVLYLNTNIFSQNRNNNYYFNSFYFGSSATYLPSDEYKTYELNWNLNFATSIGKRFYAGIQVMNVFLHYNNIETKQYVIYGMFTQLNIAPYSKFHPFLELSVNRGNYLPVKKYPKQNKKYNYLGAGGGAEIPLTFISKQIFLETSFIFYGMKINDKIRFDVYNLYVIGLNYRFGKMIVKPLKKIKN